MSIKKKISIIMPNYNDARYLFDRIESFLYQSYKPFEIIVIDDKSTDNSLEILDFFEKKKFIKLIKNSKNLGVNQSFNKGLSIASGDYFFPCSANDILNEDFFMKTISKLELNKNANLCLTYPAFYHEQENKIVTQPWLIPFKEEKYYSPKEIIDLQRRSNFHIWSHCTLFRSTVFKNELFKNDFKWFSDWYLVHKNSFLNGLYYCPEVLSYLRVSNNQYSSSATVDEKKKVIYKMMYYILTKDEKKVRDGFLKSLVFLYYFDLVILLINNKNLKIFFSDKLFIIKLFVLNIKKKFFKLFPMKLKFVIKKFIYNNIINKS